MEQWLVLGVTMLLTGCVAGVLAGLFGIGGGIVIVPVLEAGLGFAVDFDKPGGFRGREPLLRQRENRPLEDRLVQFLLEDPEPLLYGEEPILHNGEPVGYLRSGAYGHTLGGAMGMGYVSNEDGVTVDLINSGGFEIQVAGERIPARTSFRPMYDPKGERVRM